MNRITKFLSHDNKSDSIEPLDTDTAEMLAAAAVTAREKNAHITAAYWAGVDDGTAKALRDTADVRQDSYAQGVVDTIAVAVAVLMVLAAWRILT